MDSQTIPIIRMKSQLIIQGDIPIHNLDIDRPEDRKAIQLIYHLWQETQHKTSS